jgi:hypothetical protein
MSKKATSAKIETSQEITLNIKGQEIKLTKEEAIEISKKLDEITGRGPVVKIVEKEVIRERMRPNPYFHQPDGLPGDFYRRIMCHKDEFQAGQEKAEDLHSQHLRLHLSTFSAHQ